MEEPKGQCIEDIGWDEIIYRLMRRWKLILMAGALGGIIAFGVSRLLPDVYESRATIYAQQSDYFGGSLAGNLPLGLIPNTGSAAGYFLTLLDSETILRSAISDLNLGGDPRFAGGKTLDADSCLRQLRKKVAVAQRKNGAIDIVVKASSPSLAARIANRILDNLDDLVITSSRRKTKFTAAKLDETNRELEEAEDELLAFQEKNRLVAIDDETKAMIQQLTDLDGKLLAADVELQDVNSQLTHGGNISQLADLQVRKKSLESTRVYVVEKIGQLNQMMSSRPAVAVRYARLQRNVAMLSKTSEILTEQYQLANISEHGEGGDYQIIDRARPNRKPVLPRTLLNTALGGMIAFLASVLVITSKPVGKSDGVQLSPPANMRIHISRFFERTRASSLWLKSGLL